jgi:hypothetical protein
MGSFYFIWPNRPPLFIQRKKVFDFEGKNGGIMRIEPLAAKGEQN